MSRKKLNTGFWVCEGVLTAAALFFAFALVGYRTISLCLGLSALAVAVFKILKIAAEKHPQTAKTIRTALIILMTLTIIVFAVAEVPVLLSSKTDDSPEAPYLIVLGAGVNGTIPSLSLLNRLEAAKDYLDEYPQAVVIVSGGQGQGEDITEARCMNDWLIKNGIAPNRVIMEEKAVNTKENIRFSLDIIQSRGDDPEAKVAIVSSEYHLYRAKYMAKQLGAQPFGVAGKTSYPILRLNYFIREAAAVLYLWVF